MLLRKMIGKAIPLFIARCGLLVLQIKPSYMSLTPDRTRLIKRKQITGFSLMSSFKMRMILDHMNYSGLLMITTSKTSQLLAAMFSTKSLCLMATDLLALHPSEKRMR
ncbi:uncharacterized protein PGTG_15948 [Puccinia graminis f. sp. tritici CRL 75-36-700-3]|uniref:Uncharacterized protein n=1 Tax=Puccinia graminis f. sp. tritici (strain CRL 75-36-700-3 / race SCCL) TaxID=418459 RepID=E3L0P6_PUCGT|nr:uncharacterized protein PGTG_15948 [Puccinia graminis f. sp. tritici CRL 75-36-700-3]EFP90100.2 hypothetical protein PGTG_15948 [Puccinia graminis f. sp. tritici CRL 75-36-700-3]